MEQQGPTIPRPPQQRAAAESRCPSCGDSIEPGMRFCEACGYDLVSGQAAAQGPMGVAAEPDGPRSPLLWLVVVLWAILTVAGLIWLYSRAILL